MEFLRKSLNSNPWVTWRFRKYTASPIRIPWSNYREQVWDYNYRFMATALVAGFFFYPVACMIGRRFKVSNGGVPLAPINKFQHSFPDLNPIFESRRQFRRWSVLSTVLFSYFAASKLTSRRHVYDDWYSRPDYKPYPAMVKKEGIAKIQEDYLMEKNYPWRFKSDYKRSAVYRFFFPELADWTIKDNPYKHINPRDVYDP